ncbi:alpha/beta hydrolase family protein [Paraburkholderia strydomiana]|uniref:alpha/beta hydrolase family protein n=1 Tax=Paraburkholderia strydomiana TaxID=1245417 RepID=UPI001BEC83BE|nr:alpha/beta fold hydrolase [Paraburkholderia strydomiana]MBT2790053.1 prolyl oligopeptidase family serine peptidase [Paraburkholderia strydomiana]
MNYRTIGAALLTIVAAAACGGGGSSKSSNNPPNGDGSRGRLITAPALVQSFDVPQLTSQLASISPAVLAVAGPPKCAVSIYSIRYRTIGGKNEATTAGGAVMVPSGSAPGCNGARPVVLYAHGTSTDKNLDMTKLGGDIDGEIDSALAAAFYAAQGFVVVAPNYAGYAGSALPYHPFVNALQQSSDMIDSLRAARTAFPAIGVSDSGKLFIAGYSQGGYVGMATQRAMQTSDGEFKVTATATGSGPYALSNFVDREFLGQTSAFAPLLLDMLVNSWQNSYANIFANPTDLISSTYAPRAMGLLPGTAPETLLFAQNLLPVHAVLQTGTQPGPDTSNPDTALVAQAGFDPTNFFVASNYRTGYLNDLSSHPCSDSVSNAPIRPCTPANGLRRDALLNDLRTFVPSTPTQLCGAHSDSLVFFSNTQLTAQYFTQNGVSPSNLTVIDVDPGAAPPSGRFAVLQGGFLAARAADAQSVGTSTVADQLQLASDVHKLAAPFCFAGARSLFETLQ